MLPVTKSKTKINIILIRSTKLFLKISYYKILYFKIYYFIKYSFYAILFTFHV